MINRLQLLRNIGQFDSVNAGANIALARVTLVYAENGRGKTTLSAVFRSLATGDAIPIAERRRLAAPDPPHIVVDCDGGPPPAMFQNNAWNRTLPRVAVFDDVFVDENVYSGLAVGPDHRKNLHELILGARGVALNAQVQQLVGQIEGHNVTLRTKATAIPSTVRGTLPVDEFCGLQPRPNVDYEIKAAERQVAAVRDQASIRATPGFDTVNLPAFDLAVIEAALQQDLPSLDAAAAASLQAHFASTAPGGEAWVAEGMSRAPNASAGELTGPCPFCAQDLAGSPVIGHYRAYFSDAYRDLKRSVSEALAAVERTHGGETLAGFERAVRIAGERRQFWSRFCDTPETTVDTAAIALAWQAAREAIVEALSRKQAAPLDRMELPAAAREIVQAYEADRQTVGALDELLQQANLAVALVKEQAAAGDPVALAADVARLNAVKARYTPAIAVLCDAYVAEKSAKAVAENLRDQAKAALDQYRGNAFPGYQTAINVYLERFNVGFRLDQVKAANTRGGPTCTYNVVINNTPVAVAGGEPVIGEPSFRNTLSAGDRSTLALAFFFASLDQEPALADKIIVVDDPVSSQDEHRSLTTVQELRRLALRTAQVIVLSHNKDFLCRIWEGADRTERAALQVTRDGTGSTIVHWDVDQDSVTEHDRRHALLRQYVNTGAPNSRDVARSIRPLLEAFLRVACPEQFPPGTLLGPFRAVCAQRLGTPNEVLGSELVQELNDLTEYANKFHHETNLAWATENINDGELRGYVGRAMAFAKR